MTASRLRWALLASLVVNLVVVGAVAGALLSDRRAPADATAPSGGQVEMLGLVRNLDRRERRSLIQALRRDEVLQGARQDLRAARADLQAALRSEPFDRGAVEAAMAAQMDAQQIVVARGMAIAIDRIETLPVEERRDLMDGIGRNRRLGN